jgi:hypothetical protein
LAWKRAKKAKVQSFFHALDVIKANAIVKYFHLRSRYPHNHKESYDTDLSEISAYPYISFNKFRTIELALIRRAVNLLPTMAPYFDFPSPMDLARFVNSVISSAGAVQTATRQPRTGNTKNQILRAFESLKTEFRKIDQIFAEFPELRNAFDEVLRLLNFRANITSFDDFHHLPSALFLIRLSMMYIDIDLETAGEPGRIFTFTPQSSKPKLTCVDRAAYICKRFNGPKIVSTPGSDFSFFCALLFEIGTQKKEESMQGAIISFFSGARPELVWYSEGCNNDELSDAEMDVWAAQYESRRANILVKLASHFTKDTPAFVDLMRVAVDQIQNANAWAEGSRKRSKA